MKKPQKQTYSLFSVCSREELLSLQCVIIFCSKAYFSTFNQEDLTFSIIAAQALVAQ